MHSASRTSANRPPVRPPASAARLEPAPSMSLSGVGEGSSGSPSPSKSSCAPSPSVSPGIGTPGGSGRPPLGGDAAAETDAAAVGEAPGEADDAGDGAGEEAGEDAGVSAGGATDGCGDGGSGDADGDGVGPDGSSSASGSTSGGVCWRCRRGDSGTASTGMSRQSASRTRRSGFAMVLRNWRGSGEGDGWKMRRGQAFWQVGQGVKL